MSTGEASPKRESTPGSTPPISSIPQKRAFDDVDHAPVVSSPLNPDFKPKTQDDAPLVRDRASRAKKETLKKRESKGGSLAPESNGRATPDPKALSKIKKEEAILSPIRYKLAPPKPTDFDPPRGPVFVPSHTIIAPDGSEIQFNETTDQ
jgi:COMPASS component BRE2